MPYAYYLPQLENDIGDRLNGDATLLALLAVHPLGASVGKGIYNTIVPVAQTGTVFPCIVYQVESAGSADALRDRVRRARVTFSIYVDRSPSSGYQPIKRGMDIMARIEGDWTEQAAGTAPTYGIDRWQPTLGTTTWSATIFEYEGDLAAHDEDQYHWVYTAGCYVSRAGA